jgi:hypothetical protein
MYVLNIIKIYKFYAVLTWKKYVQIARYLANIKVINSKTSKKYSNSKK